jgi:hypothetical protein
MDRQNMIDIGCTFVANGLLETVVRKTDTDAFPAA